MLESSSLPLEHHNRSANVTRLLLGELSPTVLRGFQVASFATSSVVDGGRRQKSLPEDHCALLKWPTGLNSLNPNKQRPVSCLERLLPLSISSMDIANLPKSAAHLRYIVLAKALASVKTKDENHFWTKAHESALVEWLRHSFIIPLPSMLLPSSALLGHHTQMAEHLQLESTMAFDFGEKALSAKRPPSRTAKECAARLDILLTMHYGLRA